MIGFTLNLAYAAAYACVIYTAAKKQQVVWYTLTLTGYTLSVILAHYSLTEAH